MMGRGISCILGVGQLLSLSLVLAGCLGESSSSSGGGASQSQCAPLSSFQLPRTSEGQAQVFLGDPISASGDLYLSPYSTTLDQLLTPVTLKHLTGEGLLKGRFIEIRNSVQCSGGFGAYQIRQQFIYPHADFRFQEAMSYYYADSYQNHLNEIGYLVSQDPVRVYAHCELQDNAYFTWARDLQTGQIFQMICLGDSVETQGAYYSDDSQVLIHELQHAATGDQYSSQNDLNQLYYDEAGSMNEAISDFMALAYSDSTGGGSHELDPRVFSRWALGTFFQGSDESRGSHQCPAYDPRFPQCDSFPTFNGSSLSAPVAISYVYPDGLGWPYRSPAAGTHPLVDVFKGYSSQEEIHNAGTILTGALWDAYALIKQNHAGDSKVSFRIMSQVILEALRHLPQPDLTQNHSPVTFIELAHQLVTYFSYIQGVTDQDQSSLIQVFTQRGLYHAPEIQDPNWLTVGSGTNFRLKTSKTPGLRIIDDPIVLKRWLVDQGSDPTVIRQDLSQALNSELDPGEVAMIWFDLKNHSNITAGGVLITVSSLDPEVEVLDGRFNIGYLSGSNDHQTQVMYGKVNGSDIVSALNSPSSLEAVPTSNTYFSTNPYFYQSYRTGVWIRSAVTAAHGKWVRFRVQAKPANGVLSTQEFSLQLH